MNIKVRILISWTLILLIAVLTLSYWTTTIITENEEANLQNYLDSVLSSVHDSVDHYHQLLEKNNISSIPSYVSQYQQTALEGFEKLNFYWSGWLTIFNERGDVIYTSGDQQPQLLSNLWQQMQSTFELTSASGVQHGTSDDILFSAFSFEPWGWYVATSAGIDALNNSVDEIQRSLLLWSILTFLFSLLLIITAVNKQLFGPIERLRAAARSLAQKDYVSHIPIETRDIFGKLARDMEVLSSRLQEHDQRLVQTNIELEQRIRESTQELREKTDRLESENRAHKKTEKALREQENQYKNIIKYSPDAIFINFNDKVLMANDACVELFGADSPDQLIGRNIYDCFHPDYRSFVRERVRILKEEQKPVEIAFEKILRLDGKPVDVDVTAAPFPYKDSVAIHVILRDITGKIELEEQLRQAQKMDAIGRLAGGVAHDFNNMLGVILGYSELALATPGIKDEVAEQIQQVLKAGQRSADLTRQLLAFSRKQTISPKPLDINMAVEGSLKMLQKVIREDIELEWLPCRGQTTVFFDSSQLDQILVNLCINARDAINGAGKITISTELLSLTSAHPMIRQTQMHSGNFVILKVHDSGSGISEEHLEHIFEPFYSTKKDMGTGLGLATVYGIVKQNEGHIYAASSSGSGTTFTIYLRLYEGGMEEEQSISGKKNKRINFSNMNILFVEDELSLSSMTETMLKNLGCTVTTYTSAEQALILPGEFIRTLDLLLTDVVMPGMNGKELSQKLRGIHPDLKVIFISGYSADILPTLGTLDEDTAFLQKPFTITELAEKIAGMM